MSREQHMNMYFPTFVSDIRLGMSKLFNKFSEKKLNVVFKVEIKQ